MLLLSAGERGLFCWLYRSAQLLLHSTCSVGLKRNVHCRITIKLGPRYDMGDKLPSEHDGWTFAFGGDDFGIWEKK